MPARRLPYRTGALVALSALALVAAACGGPSGKSAAPKTRHHPRASGSTTTSSPPRSTTTTTTTAAPARGGPVPAGFEPVSFTAVSEDEYWLLGTAPCSNPVCTSIVRTTDGGRQFVGLPAPTSPVTTGGTTRSPTAITSLRFADTQDGYAFGPGSGAPLWDTHDGGEQWTETTLRGVLAFGIGDGDAFAVTGTCASGPCTGVQLRRTPVVSDDWTALPLPVSSITEVRTMTVHGASLWMSVTRGGVQTSHETLVVSSDAGGHFSVMQSPCPADLGGTLEAASPTVVWATCPSGMLAGAYRTTDGGATWTPLHAPEMPNSARIAPADDTTAVITYGSTMLRTTDGGASFSTVYGPGSVHGTWTFVGFTDASTGAAILRITGGNGSPGHQLWRSTDGGAAWTGPVVFTS